MFCNPSLPLIKILPINFLLLPKDYVLAQPQAQISVFKTSGLAPFTVLFNAKNSSGNIVRYEWNFNDSNSDYPPTDEGRMVGHRFDNPGSYNVQLTIYEENGNQAKRPSPSPLSLLQPTPRPTMSP